MRRGLAAWLRRVAGRIHSEPPPPAPPKLSPGDLFGLAGSSRLDREEFDRGRIRMRYSATDSVWDDVEADPRLTGLREHVRRLCLATQELGTHALGEGWDDVAHNLRMAYSLVDVFATTDVDGASMWCSPVADYEAANGEVTEKHLAATIVFTFAWTAYECAVTLIAGPNRRKSGRGASGRDLVAAIGAEAVPFLRDVALRAAELDGGATKFGHPDMVRMLRGG